MADPAIVINCGTAGGTTVTDTASIAGAVADFVSANAQADHDSLVSYVAVVDPDAKINDLDPGDLAAADLVNDGSGD